MEPRKQELLEAELDPGEKLIWVGQPDPLREVLQGSIVLFVFGVIWTAITIGGAIFWWQDISPSLGISWVIRIASTFFILPFILIGLGCLLSPRWAYVQSAKTAYGITDKRVIIVKGVKKRFVESYSRAAIGTVKRRERGDGTGDLIFAQEYSSDGDGDRRTTDIQLTGIPEVRAVEVLLRQALTASR